jgi:CBS domain-containing protein
MENTIAERIADFLKDFKPFVFLEYSQLVDIAKSIRVINIEKNKSLFQINDPLHDSFYVVASGSMNLFIFSDAEETILNACRAGDVFGLRPFFAKNNYMMTAKAREESLIYAIPIEKFKPLLAENPKVLDFLLQHFASTSNATRENSEHNIADSIQYGNSQTEIQYFQSISYSKNPLKSSPSASVQEVALLMTDAMIDNVLISDNNRPIGIVTDRDFRTKIATGRYPITTSIEKIMSSPVVTVLENLSLAEAQLLMLKNNVSHLCVTEDGTETSEIKGMISEHDLVVAQANNPGVMIKEIKRARSENELKVIRQKLAELIHTSLSKNIPLYHISVITGEINFALTKRAIELAFLEMGSAPARFVWLNIGSQGRKEQLLLTDQDSMLVFENVSPERHKDVKEYFLKLAKKVTTTLEKVGYKPCQYGHIASNPKWCKSLNDWIIQYNNWINTPGENTDEISSVFFDYDLVYGDAQLEEALTETIFDSSKNHVLLFDFLGNEALKKPAPLNFFKKFVLEEEGEFKGKFDINNRALSALIDMGRLLVMSQNIKGINNTYLRFKQLASVDNEHEELYLNAAEAFLLLSKFKTIDGLSNDGSGQYINLEEISKSDKEKMKNSFQVIKDLEDIIKDKFQLTHFS